MHALASKRSSRILAMIASAFLLAACGQGSGPESIPNQPVTPLPPGDEGMMAELSDSSGIAIALDESLNGPGRERWLSPGGWKGPLVIKPLLMGNVTLLMEQLRPLARQLVFSSVFETGIGLRQALALADMLPEMTYAVGFDTRSAFADDLAGSRSGPWIRAAERNAIDPQEIWKKLPHSI